MIRLRSINQVVCNRALLLNECQRDGQRIIVAGRNRLWVTIVLPAMLASLTSAKRPPSLS
jgi:hypothetical protein